MIKNRTAILRMAPISQDYSTFDLLAFPTERFRYTLSLILLFVRIIASVVLAIWVHWAFAFLIILVPIAFYGTRSLLIALIWIFIFSLISLITGQNAPRLVFIFSGIGVLTTFAGLNFRKVYLHALFHRAFSSEKVFSYLFTTGKITVEIDSIGIIHRLN